MITMAFSGQILGDYRLNQKVLGSLLVLILTLAAGIWFANQYLTRQFRISEGQTLVQSLSASLLASQVEGNSHSAQGLLLSLSGNPHVNSAALYNDEGALLAQYLSSEFSGSLPEISGPPGIKIEGAAIEIFYSLSTDDTRPSSTLYLNLALEGDSLQWKLLGFLMLALLTGFGVGYITWLTFLNKPTGKSKSPASSSSIGKLRELPEEGSSSESDFDRDFIKVLEMEERLKLEVLIRKQGEDILKTHHRILKHLAVGNSLEEVLDLVNLNLKRQMLPDTVCAIYLLDEENSELTLISAPQLCDSSQLGLRKWDVSPNEITFGVCAHFNEIVIVENLADDPHWARLLDNSVIKEYNACWSVPIPDPSGNPIGVVGVLCQHTRSPSVEELKHLNSSAFLAGMAITRKQYEEDLHNYSRELARSNQDLDEFASIASHDLQEPLRKVTAFGERLKKHSGENMDERGKDYLERMLRGTIRMQNFITDLLEYSRAGAKAGPLTPIDLNQLIKDILIDFEFRIEEVGASIQIEPLPTVDGDPVRLRQVFANLIGNALKFIREGVPPQLRITTSTPSKHHIRIHVEDNGIGFDDSLSSRIFRPFERLNPTHAFKGSGMGLALCRKIVERHGGTISATSVKGKGTRITVELSTVRKTD